MSLLHRLSYVLPRPFWAIWVFGLVAVLLVPLGLFGRGLRDDDWHIFPEQREARVENPGGLAAACFGVFAATYIGFMLWAEDFAYQDGHWFTEYSAIGK